ncbi:hypothetical protein AcV7_009961 [Taiwanofungus camphoratus]|nr:hypothetical protein AcV7_009961 [Antrodia cinnamomea]
MGLNRLTHVFAEQGPFRSPTSPSSPQLSPSSASTPLSSASPSRHVRARSASPSRRHFPLPSRPLSLDRTSHLHESSPLDKGFLSDTLVDTSHRPSKATRATSRLSDTKRRARDSVERVLSIAGLIAHDAFGMGGPLLSLAPIPALDVAAKTLQNIWDAVLKVQINQAACYRLVERCATMWISIRDNIDAGNVDIMQLLDPISRFEHSLTWICGCMQKQLQMPFWERYLRRQQLREGLKYYHANLSDVFNMFNNSIVLQVFNMLKQLDDSGIQRGRPLLDSLQPPSVASTIDPATGKLNRDRLQHAFKSQNTQDARQDERYLETMMDRLRQRHDKDLKSMIARLCSVDQKDELSRKEAESQQYGMYKWSESDPSISRWLDETVAFSQPSYLWIVASPRTGRSILAAYLISRLVASRSPDEIVLYYFCVTRDQPNSSLILRSLIVQALETQHDLIYLKHMDYLKHVVLGTEHNESFSVDDLWDIFSRLLDCFARFSVIIDGLDHCNEEVVLPGGVISRLSALGKCQIRVLLLSRKNKMQSILGSWPQVDISGAGTSPSDLYDLVAARTEKLKKEIQCLRTEVDLEGRILTSASGMFPHVRTVYIRLLIDHIFRMKDASYHVLDELLSRPPPDLDAMYEAYLIGLFRRNKLQHRLNEAAVRALQWILHSSFKSLPLMPSFLNRMLAIDPRNVDFDPRNPLDGIQSRVHQALGVLVDIRLDVKLRSVRVELADQSFEAFLSGDRFRSSHDLRPLFILLQRESVFFSLLTTCSIMLTVPEVEDHQQRTKDDIDRIEKQLISKSNSTRKRERCWPNLLIIGMRRTSMALPLNPGWSGRAEDNLWPAVYRLVSATADKDIRRLTSYSLLYLESFLSTNHDPRHAIGTERSALLTALFSSMNQCSVYSVRIAIDIVSSESPRVLMPTVNVDNYRDLAAALRSLANVLVNILHILDSSPSTLRPDGRLPRYHPVRTRPSMWDIRGGSLFDLRTNIMNLYDCVMSWLRPRAHSQSRTVRYDAAVQIVMEDLMDVDSALKRFDEHEELVIGLFNLKDGIRRTFQIFTYLNDISPHQNRPTHTESRHTAHRHEPGSALTKMHTGEFHLLDIDVKLCFTYFYISIPSCAVLMSCSVLGLIQYPAWTVILLRILVSDKAEHQYSFRRCHFFLIRKMARTVSSLLLVMWLCSMCAHLRTFSILGWTLNLAAIFHATGHIALLFRMPKLDGHGGSPSHSLRTWARAQHREPTNDATNSVNGSVNIDDTGTSTSRGDIRESNGEEDTGHDEGPHAAIPCQELQLCVTAVCPSLFYGAQCIFSALSANWYALTSVLCFRDPSIISTLDYIAAFYVMRGCLVYFADPAGMLRAIDSINNAKGEFEELNSRIPAARNAAVETLRVEWDEFFKPVDALG